MITRRFERDDESGVRRFWEVELDGVHMSQRKGQAAGGLIDGKRRSFASVERATAEAELRIATQLRTGWTEVTRGFVPAPVRNHALEAAIVDDVDDPAAWSVYADWLQSRGDPFGEWLALSLDGALEDSDPRAAGLWSTELLWLAERTDIEAIARLEHRHGFVTRARFHEPGYHDDSRALGRLLAALLRSPTAWLLRSLTMATARGVMVDALLGDNDTIMLEHLREPTLGEFVLPEFAWVFVGALDRVLQACPSLETLHARGTAMLWKSPIDHARLGNLTMEAVGLTGEAVEAIVQSHLPNLRRLELWLGHRERESNATFEHLRPLFDDDSCMAGLRELGLRNCWFADALAEALAKSRRLARLESIDLSFWNDGRAWRCRHPRACAGVWAFAFARSPGQLPSAPDRPRPRRRTAEDRANGRSDRSGNRAIRRTARILCRGRRMKESPAHPSARRFSPAATDSNPRWTFAP